MASKQIQPFVFEFLLFSFIPLILPYFVDSD
jgi:hypothetical protein